MPNHDIDNIYNMLHLTFVFICLWEIFVVVFKNKCISIWQKLFSIFLFPIVTLIVLQADNNK